MIYLTPNKCKKCFLKQPSFNYPGKELQAAYCGDCKEDGMVNLKSIKCKKCFLKQPSFNYPGLKEQYCNNCKEEGMVNIKLIKEKLTKEAKKILELI